MPSPRVASAFALLAVVLSTSTAFAQGVGINATGAAADTSAILDLSATNKGLLLPRMTAAQRAAIVLPANGLVVYQTDGTAGLYYNAGTSASPSWQLVGANASGGQWSASGSNLYFSTGKVAVGTTPGTYRFTVQDTGSVLRVAAINANGVMASFGGAGQIQVDAPGVFGGRLALLDNGYLGLGRVTPLARLDIAGGNYDLAATEGDVRIGDGTYRIKFGVATAGGGAGGATIMQHGVAGTYNVLALGAQGNKVAYVNGNTSRFGIGTDNPAAPLGFAATTGKKIALYPGVTNDYGLGIASGRLQIYSDGTPSGDVAIGTDAAGTFTERLAVKNTGALAVSGNTGTAGQVLQSNGSGAPATWVNPTNSAYNNFYSIETINSVAIAASATQALPDLSQTISLAGSARVRVDLSVSIWAPSCAFCAATEAEAKLFIDGVEVHDWRQEVSNGGHGTVNGTFIRTLAAGSHTISVSGTPYFTGATFGTANPRYANTLYIQITPQ